MLGDVCTSCQHTTSECTCPEGPCLPSNDVAECEDWLSMTCVFWMGDDIPGTPIKKGTRMSEVVTYFLAEIKALKARVTTLETP